MTNPEAMTILGTAAKAAIADVSSLIGDRSIKNLNLPIISQ